MSLLRSRSYSPLALLREGLRGHRGWPALWRDPTPKRRYQAVIIGGGGHGLATAYYLAKTHGLTDVAVLESGWIGGGNTGRNTTAIRSNYYYPESARLYDFSLRLYEGLTRELNYNVMVSQRGSCFLAHSPGQMEILQRLCNQMHINGIDAEMMDRARVERLAPVLNFRPDARLPIFGGLIQPRGGTARHDAVAWGYARAADALGVAILQRCPVQGFVIQNGVARAVETPHGRIEAEVFALSVAGQSGVLADLAGFRLPLHSYTLQAFVSEPVKPCLDTVILAGTATYVSQSDKGELVIGGGLDRVPSYARRGGFAMMQQVLAGLVEIAPAFGQLRLLRQWGGTVDVAPDSSPILGPSPIGQLHLNCGWGTGGFKAIPVGGWVTAHHLATGRVHPLAEPFGLSRFAEGRLIDEAASSGIAH